MDLHAYANAINALAQAKGWHDNKIWLALGVFKEFAELWQAYEHLGDPEVKTLKVRCVKCLGDMVEVANADASTNKQYVKSFVCPIDKDQAVIIVMDRITEDDLGKEFSGTMHYLLQVMTKLAPTVDLDRALRSEIEKNKTTLKKTYDGTNIVRK